MVNKIVLFFVMAATVFAQAHEFEVASIRPAAAPTPGAVAVGLHIDGSQVRISYLSLKDYIGIAYRVRTSQIVGPDWLSSQRFDIAAKLPEGTSQANVLEMLQALLKDRFQLKVHRETKELPVYALEVAKSGSKLTESAPLPGDDSESAGGAI